ncbi:hypothetical protein SteCoe_38740 [Stentor coeruleus]|uniref:Uncharacterized protein n=1 Tax=Stentor coeruleus TaxID=5963 RepID=A0A1R2AL65_9CILI|nr:hypothetical protein SteCoe_38740 [Stentor coeruleus]
MHSYRHLSGLDIHSEPCYNFSCIQTFFHPKNEIINEYAGSNYSSDLALGKSGLAIALLAFFMLKNLAYMKEGVSCNIQHSSGFGSLESKSQAYSDQKVKLITSLIALLYVMLSKEYYYFYLIFCTLAYIYLTFQYIYYLPYYQDFSNVVYACEFLNSAFMVSFFGIGIGFGNAAASFILCLCILPLICITCYSCIEYRKTKIPSSASLDLPINIFELACRKKFINSKPSNKVSHLMQEYFSKNNSSIALVYLAYHLNSKHLQPKNALIQVSRANYIKPRVSSI